MRAVLPELRQSGPFFPADRSGFVWYIVCLCRLFLPAKAFVTSPSAAKHTVSAREKQPRRDILFPVFRVRHGVVGPRGKEGIFSLSCGVGDAQANIKKNIKPEHTVRCKRYTFCNRTAREHVVLWQQKTLSLKKRKGFRLTQII